MLVPDSPISMMGANKRGRKARISGYTFKWLQGPGNVNGYRSGAGAVANDGALERTLAQFPGLLFFPREANSGFLNIGNQLKIVSNARTT